MGIWEKFSDIASAEEVVEKVLTNKPLPVGEYNMLLKKIEPAESRNGLPMLKGEFVLVDGGRKVFYNQLLMNENYPDMTPKNIADAVVFLSALTGEEIEFTGMEDLESLVYDIETDVEYLVKISYRDKDTDQKYPQLEIVERVEYGTSEF